jgi:N-acetylglucosamine-6-phosphate deacetylase
MGMEKQLGKIKKGFLANIVVLNEKMEVKELVS